MSNPVTVRCTSWPALRSGVKWTQAYPFTCARRFLLCRSPWKMIITWLGWLLDMSRALDCFAALALVLPLVQCYNPCMANNFAVTIMISAVQCSYATAKLSTYSLSTTFRTQIDYRQSSSSAQGFTFRVSSTPASA